MNQKLFHDEFCQKLSEKKIIWGVNNFWISIIYVSKSLASLVYFLFLLLFFVSSLPVIYFTFFDSYWYLIFFIPVFFACLSGNPNLNLIDVTFWCLIFVVSGISSLIFRSDFYRIGWIPVVCFILSSVIKGTALVEVENQLIDSSEKYQLLNNENRLLIYEIYDKN